MFSIFFSRELEEINKLLLHLGGLVEDNFRKAVQSAINHDGELGRTVVSLDNQIDEAEIQVEEECLKAMALHQPVAKDLRYLVAVLKINNDLERIGDLAANMAERTIQLAEVKAKDAPFNVEAMAEKVETMLEMALDALVNYDLKLANEAIEMDDEVDAMHKDAFTAVKKQIRENPKDMDAQINYLSISRYLERIADLATNIAEDVVYMIEGKIVRHIL